MKYYICNLGWLLKIDDNKCCYIYQYDQWYTMEYPTEQDLSTWKELTEDEVMLKLL